MSAAQEITRTLRKREQYRKVVFIAKQVFTVVQFFAAAALVYALLVFGLVL